MNGAQVSYMGPVPSSYTWNLNDDRITLRLTKVTLFYVCLFGGSTGGIWIYQGVYVMY